MYTIPSSSLPGPSSKTLGYPEKCKFCPDVQHPYLPVIYIVWIPPTAAQSLALTLSLTGLSSSQAQFFNWVMNYFGMVEWSVKWRSNPGHRYNHSVCGGGLSHRI